jgi:UDP-glucose 4-epimerase
VELLSAGHDVIVVDNLSNSNAESLRRVERITGKSLAFYRVDVCDAEAIQSILEEHPVDCLLHFAGYKAVGESVALPLKYYRNNLDTTLTLCETMQRCGVKRIVFSSSATVYRQDNPMPVSEEAALGCINPYGCTKLMCEQILGDVMAAESDSCAVLLRYFNPVGAHESGLIGEDPKGTPNNLMPYICQTAIGRRPELSVFGDDYDTQDGTGVRDYIHVMDLAKGHVAALAFAMTHSGAHAFNLGTGQGYSVLQMVQAFQRVNDVKVPYHVAARRAGDLPVCYADPTKAETVLGWKAVKNIDDMCADAWRWQVRNPAGY